MLIYAQERTNKVEVNIKNVGLNSLYVMASGRLDLDNAVEYGTSIKDYIEDSNDEITELTLDFSEITFLSSFGLKVILELYQFMKAQGSMKLVGVSEEIMKTFKMVGFDKFLKFE